MTRVRCACAAASDSYREEQSLRSLASQGFCALGEAAAGAASELGHCSSGARGGGGGGSSAGIGGGGGGGGTGGVAGGRAADNEAGEKVNQGTSSELASLASAPSEGGAGRAAAAAAAVCVAAAGGVSLSALRSAEGAAAEEEARRAELVQLQKQMPHHGESTHVSPPLPGERRHLDPLLARPSQQEGTADPAAMKRMAERPAQRWLQVRRPRLGPRACCRCVPPPGAPVHASALMHARTPPQCMLLFGAVHATLSVVSCTPRGAWDLAIAVGVLPVLIALVFKVRRTHTAPGPPPLPPSTHLLAPVRPPDWHGYPWPQVPSVLQPMVLSLSLEALVDRRAVQQVCQQAQLRKLLQSVQVRSRERARRARAHTAAPRRRAHAPERLAEAPRRLTTPPSRPCSECPIVRRSLPLVPIPWCRRRRAYTTRSAPPGWMGSSHAQGQPWGGPGIDSEPPRGARRFYGVACLAL